jgi:gliding motility-associated-like protein
LNNSTNCNNAAFKFDFAVSSAIAGGTQKVCANAGPTQITGASPAGGVWSGTAVTQAGVFTPSQALIGTHLLTYTTTVGACVSFATKTVTVVPETKAAIGPIDSVYCIYSPDITLAASPTGGTWSGTGVKNGNVWSAATAGPGNHQITYTYTDTVGCVSSATKQVRVALPVTPNAGPDEGICAISDPFQLAGATPAGGVWSGKGVTPGGIFTPDPSLIGTQTLTYTVNLGSCVYSATKKVQVDPVPNVFAKLELGNCGTDTTAKGFAPLQITFQNNTPIGKTYTWDFGDGNKSNEPNPVHVYSQPGTYVVKLTTDFGRGCVRESTVNTVTVMKEKIPNIITPNGDKLNDNFVPQVSCNPTNLTIYSRWGHVIYKNENYNGEFHADKISSGTYYYHIQDTQGRNWKGWLEIMK